MTVRSVSPRGLTRKYRIFCFLHVFTLSSRYRRQTPDGNLSYAEDRRLHFWSTSLYFQYIIFCSVKDFMIIFHLILPENLSCSLRQIRLNRCRIVHVIVAMLESKCLRFIFLVFILKSVLIFYYSNFYWWRRN